MQRLIINVTGDQYTRSFYDQFLNIYCKRGFGVLQNCKYLFVFFPFQVRQVTSHISVKHVFITT